MYEIFVCDDDSNITDFLKFFIMKNFQDKYRVITMNRCQELLGMIDIKEHIPDILIMDINLEDGNGIDVVKHIQDEYPNIKVIYLTGIIKYATSIFETNPSYFLLKPIREHELCDAINKVTNSIDQEKKDSIILKINGSEILLYRRDIVYLESQGRKVLIHNSNGSITEIYEKIDIFQEQLGSNFVRSHKSFLINMKYIIKRTNKEFVLSDETILPISKANLKEAKMRFISYLGGM